MINEYEISDKPRRSRYIDEEGIIDIADKYKLDCDIVKEIYHDLKVHELTESINSMINSGDYWFENYKSEISILRLADRLSSLEYIVDYLSLDIASWKYILDSIRDDMPTILDLVSPED